MTNNATQFSIADMAQEFDITARAIRFYEDQGLLTPQRQGANGRVRVYSARDRTRLKLTLRGKRLGLTLSEIKELVDMYESQKDQSAQLSRFVMVLAQHRHNLEQQREDIEVTLAEISTQEKQCKKWLMQHTLSVNAPPPNALRVHKNPVKKPAKKSTKISI